MGYDQPQLEYQVQAAAAHLRQALHMLSIAMCEVRGHRQHVAKARDHSKTASKQLKAILRTIGTPEEEQGE